MFGEEGWVFESDRFFEWNKWSTRHVVVVPLGLSNDSHTFGLSHTNSYSQARHQQEIRSISNRESFHAITLCNHAHLFPKTSVVLIVRLKMKGTSSKKISCRGFGHARLLHAHALSPAQECSSSIGLLMFGCLSSTPGHQNLNFWSAIFFGGTIAFSLLESLEK